MEAAANRFELIESPPPASAGQDEGEESLDLPESPVVDPLGESGDPFGPAYSAAEAEAWPEPEVADPLDGQPEGDDAALNETLAQTSDNFAGAGFSSADLWRTFIEAGVPAEDIPELVDSPGTVLAALERGGVPGKEGLELLAQHIVRVNGADQARQQREERDEAYRAKVDEMYGAPPDPMEAMLDRKIAPLMEHFQRQQQREEAEVANRQLIGMYDSAFSALTGDLVARGQKPPDPRVFASTMDRLGLLGNPQIDPRTATRLCWSHIRGTSPQIPQSSRVGRHARDPRATFVIPSGPTGTPDVPFKDTDPLGGGPL